MKASLLRDMVELARSPKLLGAQLGKDSALQLAIAPGGLHRLPYHSSRAGRISFSRSTVTGMSSAVVPH